MRVFSTRIWLFVLCLIGSGLYVKAQHTAYYASLPLRESPYPKYQGIVPLSENEAMARNHYRFEYDSRNRPVSVSFWHQNMLIAPNHTANYFFQAAIQRIAYKPGKEIVTFYDRFNNPMTLTGGVVREVYTLNERGKRTSLHFEDANGNKVENRWGIAHYEWEVQRDGSVVENRYGLNGEAKSLRPGFPFNRIRLYYEPNGMLALMQNIDEDLKLVNNETGVAQDRLQFDEEGKWYGWNVLDASNQLKEGNGPNVAKGINIPDEFGYETSVRYEDRSGNARKGSYGFWRGLRSYDAYGNYDITWFEDQFGKPALNDQTQFCYADYTWDAEGLNLLSIAFLGVNKEPVLRRGGYHRQLREYDASGLLVKLSYLGLDGQLINRADNGVAYMLYEYDDRNRRTVSKRYSKDGNQL